MSLEKRAQKEKEKKKQKKKKRIDTDPIGSNR